MHAIDSSCMVYTFIVYVYKTSHFVNEQWSMLRLFMFDDAWSLWYWSMMPASHAVDIATCFTWHQNDVRYICYQSIMHHIKTCYWYTMYFDKCVPSTLQIIYVINWWCMIDLLSIAFTTYSSSIHTVTHACHRILLCSQYALCIPAIDDVCYLWYGPIKHNTSMCHWYMTQALLPLMDVYSVIDITQYMISKMHIVHTVNCYCMIHLSSIYGTC